MLKSLLLAGVLVNVAAAGVPYAITPEESAACKGDAKGSAPTRIRTSIASYCA